MATYATEKGICRAREGAFVGGVCAGLAEHFELDTIVVRILAVLLFFLTLGLATIAYVALWAQLPLEPESSVPYDVRPESAESNAFGCFDCAASRETEKVVNIPLLARLAIAAGLMIVFLFVAMGVSPLMPGTQWWQFWPAGLLMVGLCLIIIPVRTRNEALWHVAGIVLTAVSASILPMSLGIMSWETVGCAFSRLWPIVLASVALFAVGLYRRVEAFLLAAAFCFVLFCLAGITFCVIPGEIEMLLFHMPSGHAMRITFVQ